MEADDLQRLRSAVQMTDEGIWVVDSSGVTEFVNTCAAELFGLRPEDCIGRGFVEVLPKISQPLAQGDLESLLRGQAVKRAMQMTRPDGSRVWIMYSTTILRDAYGKVTGGVALFVDVTAQRKALAGLQNAAKLEAVGRMASGIAHEINTPIQYISDNALFLEKVVTAFSELVSHCRRALEEGSPERLRDTFDRITRDLDVDFLLQHAPEAASGNLHGAQRIASIVRAMKEFAHPDQKEMVPTDLNRGLLATVAVSHNEYKYVADVETDLGQIPLVPCYAGELNQVFLQILVNAAHAIEDVVQDTGRKGTIRITSRREDGQVVVRISDTGAGIPEAIRSKIFDPFFTTKEPGRGTGQGLPIAYAIMAKHQGSIDFESEMGKGTTFIVRVPIHPAPV